MLENLLFIFAIMVFFTFIVVSISAIFYIKGLIKDWVVDIVAYAFTSLFFIYVVVLIIVILIRICRGGL